MRYSNFFLFCTFVWFSSCSTFNQMVVSSGSNLMFEASRDVETESNYEILKSAIAPNLKLLEGLLSQSPKNAELLLTLNKGYTALAFIVNETEMYEEEWSGKKTEDNKKQALKNYTRSFNYGIRYLENKNITYKNLLSDTALSLEKNLNNDKQDLEAVLFTAQALGGMINLQKDNMTIVAQLPVVKTMFDWVCSKKPDINFGSCEIFYGAYESGRPKMLGGNPEKGKEYFLNGIKKHPHNWLIRTSFVQYYLIPMSDEEGFTKEMSALQNIYNEFDAYHIYSPGKAEPEWNKESHVRAYQALSMKRFELMNKYRKQLF